ncbi:protein Mam3p [Diutina catenulata]
MPNRPPLSSLTLLRYAAALPVALLPRASEKAHPPMTKEEFYLNLAVSAALVLLGGVFAGLTLGLMGQDEVYLKVMASSGDKKERYYSRKVLKLIGKGKHWVLVTLLLSNVITNETLPIVLDRCLGGGWPAVVASTASIVVFGEIIPQSICVRYGLQVGAFCAPFVLCLMYVMYPIAYPCALLLDHILGEDHGTVYKKSGLKTLVTLHRTMGVERLNQDEVTIISAVLDLKEKPVSEIMTPMNRVYTMSSDTVLDQSTVEEIFNAGFSRIPIHLPGEPLNFVGMLLVRVLISYDPEDALPVSSFPLATLPETALTTSCLNILNYFQEGKSHMIVVSEKPGEPEGAVGVLTLEDVIEELIGEEIVDESDVYIDINRNIKRKHPGPLSKRNLTSYLHMLYKTSASNSKRNSLDHQPPPQVHQPQGDLFKPKNLAAHPLETNKSFVTIKRQPVLPPVKKPLTTNFNDVHTSEAAAIHQAELNSAQDNTPANIGTSAGSELHALSEDNLSPRGIPIGRKTSEEHSYRTGGIVESVVNVDGVHKIVIENVSEEEPHDDEGFSVPASPEVKKKKKRSKKRKSKQGSRHNSGTGEEEESLLG